MALSPKDEILARAGTDWSIFSHLHEAHKQDATALSRILRVHTEFGLHSGSDDGAMDVREQLDDALDRLLLVELGMDIAVLHASDFGLPPDLEGLIPLDSFLRYLDAYLFFGVRLLVGRYRPDDLLPAKADPGCNHIALALSYPPPPTGSTAEQRELLATRFLDLPETPTMRIGLRFLDGFSETKPVSEDLPDPTAPHERTRYELWLRGLWRHPARMTASEQRFLAITAGLAEWATQRAEFYGGELEGGADGSDPAWIARNPISARFAVAELYWLARVLSADISNDGRVTYGPKSWVEQIASRAEYLGDRSGADRMRRAATILRGVFDFACDLIQNSIEITAGWAHSALDPEPCGPYASRYARRWRGTFDEELNEIDRQQYLRTFNGKAVPFGPSDGNSAWSRRIRTGEYPRDEVVGLAISGGGIRSATFALGILQGLQDLDFLKHIDYLSTVSGGGYIGSWLVGNVQRTSHFLGRQTNWEDSISHLRRYSKYLAPHTGILSADAWTMWGTWLRNAFLIQLLAVSWLLCILCGCLLGKPVFDSITAFHFGDGLMGGHAVHLLERFTGSAFAGMVGSFTGEWVARILTGLSVAWVGIAVALNLVKKWKFTEVQAQKWLVIPSTISAFLTGALLWSQAAGRSAGNPFEGITTYSAIFTTAVHPWLLLLLTMLAGFVGLGWVTMNRRPWFALVYGPITILVLYLELCGVMWVFRRWAPDAPHFGWYAFVFGPSLVLLSVVVAVVLFIGLCGSGSADETREWWTRMGSWLGLYVVGYLIFSVAALFGPLWVLTLFQIHWTLKWGTVAGFLGTIAGGLFAGKSNKTSGAANSQLEFVARAGALAFIIGGLLGVATLLHVLLVNILTEFSPSSYSYWNAISDVMQNRALATFGIFVLAFVLGSMLSARVELNIFGLNYFYRNRLARCYLGATRWRPGMRNPNKFTGFDDGDTLPMDSLRHDSGTTCQRPFRGPFPIVNCTLNLGGSADLSVQTRKSASFFITPLRSGSDRQQVGFAPTGKFAGGVELGQAVAVSGAAASPNMGYNTSTLVSFLLTMFNVRLGWWFPNPSGKQWQKGRLPLNGFYYLVRELFGYASESSPFLNVSDGGHFENLGIYELIRRRAKVIIAADGECDQNLQFGSLGNLVRICETDMGARIDIDVSSVRKQENGFSRAHCAVGSITYSNGSKGWLIYLKASILGDEDVGIAQYRAVHPDFPHQSTADQFFTEDQFDAYRKLGRHVVQHSFRGANPGARLTTVAQRMYETWTPARFSSEAFLTHTRTLDKIWERLRLSAGLHPLLKELTSDRAFPTLQILPEPSPEELCACLELLQLMENVFIDLRLSDYWDHPDNRGWALLFTSWAKSPVFQRTWERSRRTFGIRFEYFCEERLGLEKEHPVARA